ncbi:hypothetical protein HY995_02880 [Candidatus Micrarchaeota archaeon]|nr:hypothetical protein [Candidatus Micrarchaeota archaeon]MBI5177006.1 hypothetical protein [Candidatus Micrarchaeota archaeon]
MKEFALANARWFVLRFLLDQRCFSERWHQVTEETAVKHVSREFGDCDRKAAGRGLSQLVAQGLVCVKKKHYGTHVWLNHTRLDEVKRMLLAPP